MKKSETCKWGKGKAECYWDLHATAAMHALVVLCVLQKSYVCDSEDSEEDGTDPEAFQTQLAFQEYYASL